MNKKLDVPHLMLVFGLLPSVTNSGGHRSRYVQLQTLVTNGSSATERRCPNTRKDAVLGLDVAWRRERASLDASRSFVCLLCMRNFVVLFPLGVRWDGYGFTPGNVVRDNQTVMQRKSLR